MLTDLNVHTEPALPSLPAAGGTLIDPVFDTEILRVAVARSGSGWTVTGNSVSPAANIDFGECTASPGAAITHFGVGTASSGTGKLLYKGTVSPNITMAVGVTPRLKTTSTITED